MTADPPPPFLVALNLTRRCNLRCAHCYLDAGARSDGAEAELDTEEARGLLDGIAELSEETMVVMTGGEPLLRPDLETLVRHAAGLGLMVVIGTNGTLLDDERIESLTAAGASGFGISLDSLDEARHDAFRGREGSWKQAMAAIEACQRASVGLSIHFSVTDDNAHELEDMIELARTCGAMVFNVFFLVCTGRGERVTNISAATYDDVLERVTRAAMEQTELIVRAKCAPHFKRLALEIDPTWPITHAHGYEAGGCLAGKRYCRVTPEGEVTACPYIEAGVGSIRERSFGEIWRDAAMFQRLREPVLLGRCGACEYREICGGCRARPLARTGELMGEDFLCGYEPRGGPLAEVATSEPTGVTWSADAEKRLSHVPGFVRKMVRKRAEAFVIEQKRSSVTAEDLSLLARRRFSKLPFRHR